MACKKATSQQEKPRSIRRAGSKSCLKSGKHFICLLETLLKLHVWLLKYLINVKVNLAQHFSIFGLIYVNYVILKLVLSTNFQMPRISNKTSEN
jgi:hypothetical protein